MGVVTENIIEASTSARIPGAHYFKEECLFHRIDSDTRRLS
jgi:hypothetical protein